MILKKKKNRSINQSINGSVINGDCCLGAGKRRKNWGGVKKRCGCLVGWVEIDFAPFHRSGICSLKHKISSIFGLI